MLDRQSSDCFHAWQSFYRGTIFESRRMEVQATCGHAHELSGPVLRDTARLSQRYPLFRAMVSQHGQFDAIPPPVFLSLSPLESM